MIKRKTIKEFALAFCILAAAGCAGTPPVTGLMSLEEAVAEAAAAVEARSRAGDAVSVVQINSPLVSLSDFLINALDSRFNAGGKLTVLARGRALESLEDEQRLQLSGLVSDETAASLGHYLGAKTVVSGDFAP